MTDHLCYRKGALWKTRTRFLATPDNIDDKDKLTKKPTRVFIPHGEIILLLFHEMNAEYEESIAFLWERQIYFAHEIDTGFAFDLDPNGANTGTQNK